MSLSQLWELVKDREASQRIRIGLDLVTEQQQDNKFVLFQATKLLVICYSNEQETNTSG